MMRIALSSGSLYSYGLGRTFELAAAAGFDAMEVLVDERWDTRQPGYLRRLAAESGLPVAVVHSPFLPHLPGWPADAVERLRAAARLAGEIGAGLVVAHLPLRIRAARVELLGFRVGRLLVPIPLPNEGGYRRFLLDGGPARLERECGVTIALENMPARRLLGRLANIYALNRLECLAAFAHVTLDTTHIGTWGADLLAVYDRLAPCVAHVHLSDYDGREHRLPGTGRLPLAELLRRLAADGYGGVVTVELGPEVLDAEEEERVQAHLRGAVEFCRRANRKLAP